MIERMAKIEVVGPLPLLSDTIDYLQEQGCFHVIGETPSAEDEHIARVVLSDEEQRDRRNLEELLTQLRAVGAHIGPGERQRADTIAEHGARLSDAGTTGLREEFLPLCESFRGHLARIENIRDDMDLLERYRGIVDALSQVGAGAGFESRTVIFDSSQEEDVEAAGDEISRRTDGELRVERAKLPDGRYLAVFVHPAEADEEARTVLWESRLNEVVLPEEYREKPLDQVREEVEKRLRGLPGELEEARQVLDDFLHEHAPAFLAAGERVTELLEKYTVRTRFAKTTYAFGVTGWIPWFEKDRFELAVKEQFGGKVVTGDLDVDPHHDAIPTKLRHRKFLGLNLGGRFSTLLGIFPPPAYGSLDPSWLMVLTVPFFLGYMVGDIGYGVLILALSAFVYLKFGKRSAIVGDVALVYMLVGVFSILFGFWFSEVFGNLYSAKVYGNPHHFWGPTGRELPHQQKAYLGAAILIGLIHMTISLVFGMIVHRREMKMGEAHAGHHFLEKLGFLLFMYGVVFFSITFVDDLLWIGEGLAGVFGSVGTVRTISYLFLGSGGIILMAAVSPPGIGLLEGLGIISNVLSYARLMAVGIASVVLANIANSILYGTEGSALWPLGILGMILVHLVNLFLAIFDPTIQGLRLHYVEFFMRFYQPTGVPFTPFSKKGGI